MKIIDELTNKLDSIEHINHEWTEDKLMRVTSNKSSHKMSISFYGREHTLFFDNWHWHFTNNDEENTELMKTVLDIINGRTRFRETYVNGKLRTTELEFIDENGEWTEYLRTGFFNWKFWKKQEIEYKIAPVEF